jgi:hypothetical protein
MVTNSTFFGPEGTGADVPAGDALAALGTLPGAAALAGAAGAGVGGAGSDLEQATTKGNARTSERMDPVVLALDRSFQTIELTFPILIPRRARRRATVTR